MGAKYSYKRCEYFPIEQILWGEITFVVSRKAGYGITFTACHNIVDLIQYPNSPIPQIPHPLPPKPHPPGGGVLGGGVGYRGLGYCMKSPML